jgi:hypothetical protein
VPDIIEAKILRSASGIACVFNTDLNPAELGPLLPPQAAYQRASIDLEKLQDHFQGVLDFAVELLGWQID